MKKALIFLAAVCLSGCASLKQFDASLSRVELGNDLKAAETIRKVHKNKEVYYEYEDELIKSAWNVNSQNIKFVLLNKTNDTMKVLWDNAAYVDVFNTSYRVIHKEIKLADASKSMPPTTIVRQTQIADIIMPADSVSYSQSGWVVRPISNDFMLSGDYQEQTVKVYLPLEFKNEILEYYFTFTVNNVEIINQNKKSRDSSWRNQREMKWEK